MFNATKLLRECQSEGKYGSMLANKDIEKFLNMGKEEVDYSSYLSHRARISLF